MGYSLSYITKYFFSRGCHTSPLCCRVYHNSLRVDDPPDVCNLTPRRACDWGRNQIREHRKGIINGDGGGKKAIDSTVIADRCRMSSFTVVTGYLGALPAQYLICMPAA